MERIPILRMGRYLLVTIQVDMHDRLALTLQNDLTARISETGARAVLLDVSSVDIVDSFIGRMISNMAAMARVLDAETVVGGMQPAVGVTPPVAYPILFWATLVATFLVGHAATDPRQSLGEALAR